MLFSSTMFLLALPSPFPWPLVYPFTAEAPLSLSHVFYSPLHNPLLCSLSSFNTYPHLYPQIYIAIYMYVYINIKG